MEDFHLMLVNCKYLAHLGVEEIVTSRQQSPAVTLKKAEGKIQWCQHSQLAPVMTKTCREPQLTVYLKMTAYEAVGSFRVFCPLNFLLNSDSRGISNYLKQNKTK